eukprot:gene5557-4058_t
MGARLCIDAAAVAAPADDRLSKQKWVAASPFSELTFPDRHSLSQQGVAVRTVRCFQAS